MAAGNLWMLAIDTSTTLTGIALYDGVSAYELIWRSGRNQTRSLLTQIRELLGLNGLALTDFGAIAVATGPGTFNGLRVGLSTAKGLAYGNDLAIYGIDTLEATAYPHRSSGQPIRAFVPAGRGRAVYCDYRVRNQRWMRAGEMQNKPFAELTAGLSEPTLLVGELSDRETLELLESDMAEIPPAALRSRKPSCVAELAWQRRERGEADEIAALEPVYVHGARNG